MHICADSNLSMPCMYRAPSCRKICTVFHRLLTTPCTLIEWFVPYAFSMGRLQYCVIQNYNVPCNHASNVPCNHASNAPSSHASNIPCSHASNVPTMRPMYHATMRPMYRATMVQRIMQPCVYHATMRPMYHGPMRPMYHATM